jgi:hypothetical protein
MGQRGMHIGYCWGSQRGRPRRRWVDNIETDLKEVECDGEDWIDIAQDRDKWRALVGMLLNLQVP